MRICFLNHNLAHSTGAGRFGLNLLDRLGRVHPGFRSVVLTSVGSNHPLEVPILHSSAWRLVLAIPRIRAIFRRCDIIHALDGWPYGVIAALAAFGLGKKLVITAIGTGALKFLRRPVRGALLGWAYRRADRLVAISNYTRGRLLGYRPGLDIRVINHAVDLEEFQGQEAIGEEEQSVIENLKPYIISVGGWKERKGFEYSFAAFAEIRKRFPQMRYVVCGIGPKRRLEEPLGLAGSVHYFKGVGWPFLKALYKNAELFMLLPYDAQGDVEGFGFAFLEAAAAGLPVIGTRESGAEDAVGDGVNGFLVPPRDARAAADAAARLLSDLALRRQMGSASRRFAQNMNWERVIDSYVGIYRELI